jgi:hypothetical protein
MHENYTIPTRSSRLRAWAIAALLMVDAALVGGLYTLWRWIA